MVDDLISKYPYFVEPMLEKYRSLEPDSEEALRLQRKISINISDIETRRRLLGIDSSYNLDIDNKTKSESSTLSTIDSFLEKFGGNLNAIPGVYIPEEPSPESKDTSDSEGIEDLTFLMKNHQYERALEIIEAGNLNNREKNIYFADQIRFLKKLIKLENQKNKP